MLTHGTPLYSWVPLPHGMTWLKVSTQSISMVRKRLPSSLFTILSKSPSKDSLISSGDSEMLLLIVMGSSKSKSWLRFALTTCLTSTELIWGILILFSLPSCSRRLVRQPYQSSLPQLKGLSRKRKMLLKPLQSPLISLWLGRKGKGKRRKSILQYRAPMKK